MHFSGRWRGCRALCSALVGAVAAQSTWGGGAKPATRLPSALHTRSDLLSFVADPARVVAVTPQRTERRLSALVIGSVRRVAPALRLPSMRHW